MIFPIRVSVEIQEREDSQDLMAFLGLKAVSVHQDLMDLR